MVNSSQVLCGLSLVSLLVLSSLVVVTKSDGDGHQQDNYMTTAELPDGEHEVRMRFGDILVREASVTSHTDKGTRLGLLLRQVASGPHFLQMVYKQKDKTGVRRKNHLVECEVINDWGAADQFRTHFQNELRRSGLSLQVPSNHRNVSVFEQDEYLETDENENTGPIPGDIIDLDQGLEDFRNVTVRILRNDEIVGDLQRSFDMILQQRLCSRLHRKQKKIAEAQKKEILNENKSRVKRGLLQMVGIVPGTLWCGVGTTADKTSTMGAHVGADRCCRSHDSCPFQLPGLSTEFGLFNYRTHTLSHCACDESRSKRELGDAFRVPGTQWCGRGFSATEMKQLGGFTGADKCCRFHDTACPYFIEGFGEKFGLFNWRMYTINHCTCDERFRSCLKTTNTGAANFVGKLFFNVVQTKCFVLKPERTCVKSSWWGKCLKYEYKKQAHLRDPVPY